MLNKLLIGLLGAGVIATGGYAAASGLDDTAPARTVSLPGATTNEGTTTGTTTTGRTTTGTTTTATTTAAAATTDDIVVGNAPAPRVAQTTGEDISGPCDEAEHANDPRCTGGTGAAGGNGDDDDRSGSNRGSDDDNNDDDDRSGSNSGSDHDDNDNDNDD